MGWEPSHPKVNLELDLSNTQAAETTHKLGSCGSLPRRRRAPGCLPWGLVVDQLHLRRTQRVVQQPALRRAQRARRQEPFDFLNAQPFVADAFYKQRLPSPIGLSDSLL